MDKKPTIAWVVPQLFEGSGGIRTIANAVGGLMRAGYDCVVVVQAYPVVVREAHDGILRDAYGLDVRVENAFYYDEQPDLLVATSWNSAYYVRDHAAARKAYFVQDYEPWFSPAGDLSLAADATYDFGFSAVTIGRWLARKLEGRCRDVVPIDFSADLSVYRLTERSRKRAICAIFQPEKPRRCPKLVEASLAAVHEIDSSIEVYLYGSGERSGLGFAHELGQLSLDECNELYNKCAVGLCCSASNPSRIPFEMMAAGLPVVDLHVENNLYDFPDDAMLLAHPTPESIARALVDLVNDDARRNDMSRAAAQFMSSRDREREDAAVTAAFAALLEGDGRRAAFSHVDRSYSRGACVSSERVGAARNINGDFKPLDLLAGDCFSVVISREGLGEMDDIVLSVWEGDERFNPVDHPMQLLDSSHASATLDMGAHGNSSNYYHLSAHARKGGQAVELGDMTTWIVCSERGLDAGQLKSLGAQTSRTQRCGETVMRIERVDKVPQPGRRFLKLGGRRGRRRG